MRTQRLLSAAASLTAALVLAGCGGGSEDTSESADDEESTSSAAFPISIEHAYGTTTIEAKPERVATVAWANHEVPLALGVVPVGMSKATWGDDDDNGILPWVEDKLDELGGETPVLFDETEGIDFEAVADTDPDVILAAYSGLTQEDYDTLSKIAPVVAYPDVAWGTSYQDMIRLDSEALGLAAEGDQLIEDLQDEVADAAEARPSLADKSVLVGYIDPTDLSQVGYYTTLDTRPGFLTADVGMTTPEVVAEGSEGTDEFYKTVSAEDADSLDDVDVLVTYGDDTVLDTLQADPLLGKIPAVERGSVVVLADSTPLAAAANPSPLNIPWGIDDYLDLMQSAADKVG